MSDQSSLKTGLHLMSGNEAIAEGALFAGCNFFAGYPITPSSEIGEVLSHRLPKVGGFFLQMEDEIASMAAVLGASLAGAKALTATSGPGFSLKQENIGYGCMAEIPCVIVNVMRGGPSTGMPTKSSQGDVMQARWGTHGDHPIIVLTPNSVEELFWETIRAFNLAERYRTPVILLSDEIISHARERMFLPKPSTVTLYNRRKPRRDPEKYVPYEGGGNPDIPTMAAYGADYRFHVTGLFHDRTGFPSNESSVVESEARRIMRKIDKNYNDIVKFEPYRLDDAEIAIVAYGAVSRSVKEAVDRLRENDENPKVGSFRIKTMWPFPERAIRRLARKVSVIVVPEMNAGQVLYEVERMAQNFCEVVPINRVDSEIIPPRQIIKVVQDL
jgi:2-oxoglutarate/2-oxoacid ferredoxin oxidoreductase subunit alpha